MNRHQNIYLVRVDKWRPVDGGDGTGGLPAALAATRSPLVCLICSRPSLPQQGYPQTPLSRRAAAEFPRFFPMDRQRPVPAVGTPVNNKFELRAP